MKMISRGRLVCLAFGVLTCFQGPAAVSFERGAWKIGYDETSSVLTFRYPDQNIVLTGKLTFESEGRVWQVVESRDAATDRLALVSGRKFVYKAGTIQGYVSFRDSGSRLEMLVYHRAGCDFFPGKLIFAGEAKVREESFACRTLAKVGERVIGFADGSGDSPNNDAIFAREEDLAVRFTAQEIDVKSRVKGVYSVRLTADIDESGAATIGTEVDSAYFKSRWAPGYRPINRRRCPKAPTGWMSWNVYFDKAGSAENLSEARIGAKYLKPFGLDIWSIESWQGNSLWLPVQDFHSFDLSCYEPQFPEGMKWLADEIRAIGFRPGIWMALYGDGDRTFYEAHHELFLHDEKGSPIDCWCGKYMLDTTKPAALDLMRKLVKTASDDWGYEFFKLDGMANTPRKFELPEVRRCAASPKDAKWFENSVRAMREGIGEDKVILGCMGDFTGTEAQFLDATRLGSDVVGCYEDSCGETYNPLGSSRWGQYPVKWANVLHQAQCTFSQVFINNLMVYTDPDTLMVGYALEKHEAEVMATVVGLPGQMMFDGDKLGSLRYDRMKMIQQVLPVADIRPQNLYPFAGTAMLPVWNLSVTRPFGKWNVVALFNWKDEPQDIAVTMAELGLDSTREYLAYEFWGQEFLGCVRDSVMLRVPMRSVKLIALREKTDHPQFVGDDRHITQGAVELADLGWEVSANVYRMTVRAIAGFPFAYVVSCPTGYRFVSASAEGGTVSAKADDGLVRLTVGAETTGDVTVRVQFESNAE